MRGTTIVIPARLNSGRVPRKVLQVIHGKTLLERVWTACADAGDVIKADVVIGADSPEVADTALSFGAKVVMTVDAANGSERVAQVARALGHINGDWLLNVQADHVGITKDAIVEFHGSLKYSHESYHCLYCAWEPITYIEKMDRNTVKVLVNKDGYALHFTRQPLPLAKKHAGIYGYTGAFLNRYLSWGVGEWEQSESLEQMRVLENGCSVRCTPLSVSTGLAINTPADLMAATGA